MTARPRTSPRELARIGGVLYLIIIVFGIFGEIFVRGKLIDWSDPSVTAANILASESSWRFGIASHLFYLICAVPLTAIFYALLRPVNRDIARVAILFNLLSIGIEAAGELHLISALNVLRSVDRLAAFAPVQLHALAPLSLLPHGRSFSISLLFFGCACWVLGYLLFRSGYFPRFVGVLMAIAGSSYLLDGFALILSPSFHAAIFPGTLVPAFVAESTFCLWLLVKGVNVEKWESRAAAAANYG